MFAGNRTKLQYPKGASAANSHMELDFTGLRAVSSQTRVRILKETPHQTQATVTSLGEELGLSKSTVSAHLDKLKDADLVERDEEDGRRRVVYRPTPIGEKLAKGRKVPIRLAALGALSLAGSAASTALKLFSPGTESIGEMGTLAEEAAPRAAEAAPSAAGTGAIELVLLAFGFALLSLSAIAYLRPVLGR
jgi:DNA-binding transcriptional ArsR family regulator